MKQIVIFLLLSIPHFANAVNPLDIIPVYAADQSEVTTESIENEAAQFAAIAEYHRSLSRLREGEYRRDSAKRDYERDRSLADRGLIPESKAQLSLLEYQSMDSEVRARAHKVDENETDAIVARFKVLEKGNPGNDYRKEIVQAMIKRNNLQLSRLDDSLSSIQAVADYMQTYYNNGKRLKDQGVISEVELTARRRQLDEVLGQKLSLEHQKEAAQKSLEGLKKTKDRL